MSLSVEARGDVRVATICREHRLNAITDDVLEALLEIVADCSSDGTRVVVIAGQGERAFSSGSDIKELAGTSPEGRLRHTALGNRLLDEIEESGSLFIAAIEGYCLGGGLELALACDLRVAGDGATFGLPEVTVSALPSWGGTYRLDRVVGAARAKEVILFGRRLSSEDALAWGLVSEVVPVGSAAARAAERAQEALSASDWATLARAKSLVRNAYGLPARLAGFLEYLADSQQSSSHDQEAAFAKFAERSGSKVPGNPVSLIDHDGKQVGSESERDRTE